MSDPSKFLRTNHRDEQVDEKQQGNDSNEDVSHVVLLKFFAEADVEAARDKKCHHSADENQVTHTISPATDLTMRIRSCRYDDSVANERLIKMPAFRVKIS
jgi:hypothetical protein